MIPARRDFAVQPGSSGSYALISARIQDPRGDLVDLTGAKVRLTATCGIDLSTDDGSLDLDLSTSAFAWYPSAAQTERVKLGRIDKYKVFVTFADGSGGPYLEGYLIGGGSLPEDPQATATIVVQGPQGPPGPSGSAANVRTYQIAGASSFTANHSFAYAPRATVLNAASELVETDISYPTGSQVYLSFLAPFTGTLYLS